MKIFISGSGKRSLAVASSLQEWLPRVIQAIEPWMPLSNLEKGSNWSSNLEFRLKESDVGIICLTPENLNSSWIHYEAGVLSRSTNARICSYLIGFEPKDLTGPLAHFQATLANRQGTFELVLSLNRALGDDSLKESILREAFEDLWPKLEDAIKKTSLEFEFDDSIKNSIDKTETNSRIELVSSDIKHLVVEALKQLNSPFPTPIEAVPNNFVFLVHGHNQGIKETVARFIESLGARVVILHEEPNEGRTIIEKFEVHSDVRYAVVLFTADDHGNTKNASSDILLPRARQNVILELGYFLGKLGRSRVCVLYEEGVEIPSDYSGVLFIPLDNLQAWRWPLAKELRNAGIPIDLNRALEKYE